MSELSDTTFLEEKNKKENKPLFLYDIYYTDSDMLTLTNLDSDLLFGGETYLAADIEHDSTGENLGGAIDTTKLSIGSIDRSIIVDMEDYDGLRGHSVKIKRIFKNQISDIECFMEESYVIDSVPSYGERFVEFELTSKFDVLDIELPLRTYDRKHCYWKFKSSECGYVGAAEACDHTLARCEELGNIERIGCFPSIPSTIWYA